MRVTEQRTQLANRGIALERLTAKLLVVLEDQRAAELAQLRGDLVKAEWGQQARAPRLKGAVCVGRRVQRAHAGPRAPAPSRTRLQCADPPRPLQIRNYVLHPYKLVKCTRTGHETSDVDGVLGGDLDAFADAWLRQQSRAANEARLSAVP